MPDIIQRVQTVLDAGEPVCKKCGQAQSYHTFRHPFQPSHNHRVEELVPELLALAIAGQSLARIAESLRQDAWRYDRDFETAFHAQVYFALERELSHFNTVAAGNTANSTT